MKYKLSNICEYVKGKVSVSTLNTSNYISTENMLPSKGGIVEASTLPPAETTQAYLKDDVLVSNIRPYFEKIWRAVIDGGCSNDVLVFRAKPHVNPTYLYYVLSDKQFFNYATATSKGTKMPRGDRSAIMEYEIEERSRKEQDNIASILYAIDKKIELNNKINNNLYEQARSLFKNYFIDNPRRDSWEIGAFSDIVETTISGDWGKDSPLGSNTEMVYCIRGADIPEVKLGNKGKMPIRYILPKNYAAKQLVDGDIVVEISGGSPTQSTGRAAAISTALLNRYDKGMVCTNFCKALKPKTGYSMFLYHYWQYLYDTDVFFSYENGTTGIKNLNINGILEKETIFLPDFELIEQFNSLCASMYQVIYANGLENEQLSSLRDSLLPKLMSGELDVSEIDI